jgi:hypothetical protein
MVHVPLALVTAAGGFVATALVVAMVGLVMVMLGRPAPRERAPE